jgi:phosphatidylglycerol---prolipoprotein diacylglyceryl transferase
MFSRCYPTISDFILHSTGMDIPLPIFSFGFFVALGFLAAAIILSSELQRKEKLGLVNSFDKTIITGLPASPLELFLNGLLGFVLGYKLVDVALNYSAFASNPQEFLLSASGNIFGGIAGAALLAYLKYREKEKQKLPEPKKEIIKVHPYELTGDITLMAAIGGISGAKIFYFFETPGNLQEFINDPFGSFFGGLTIYGGLIGGALVVYLFTRSKGIRFIHVADAVAPGLLLGYGIGRMGCQVSGDGDWGIVNLAEKPGWLPQWLWAQHYPHNIINEGIKIPGCIEKHCFMLEQPVYPTPIYETTMVLILCGILWSVRKKITWPGFMFSAYLLVNGIERLFIEQYRVNTKLEWISGINATQAEVIAVLFMLAGAAGMFLSYRITKKVI